MQKRLRAALLTISALAVIAAACSSGGSDDAGTQTPSPSTTDPDSTAARQAQPSSSLADSDVGQPVLIVSPFLEDSTLSTILFEDGTSFRFEGTRDAEGLPESIAAVIIENGDNRAVARFDPLGRVARLEMTDGASAESGAIEFSYGSDSIELQFFADSSATEPSGNASIPLEDFPEVVEQLEQLTVTGLLDRAKSRPVLLSDTTPTRPASPATSTQTAPSRLRLTTHVRHAGGSPVTSGFALEWQTRQPLPATRLDEAIPDFIRRGELQPTADPGVFRAESSLLVPLTPAQIAASCDAALNPNTAGGTNVFVGLTAFRCSWRRPPSSATSPPSALGPA